MPDHPPAPAALRAERAAAYLDVSATFFRQHIAPALTAVRVTKGVILYRRADLDSWLDRQANGGATSQEANPWLAP
jgi:hypothetical protein